MMRIHDWRDEDDGHGTWWRLHRHQYKPIARRFPPTIVAIWCEVVCWLFGHRTASTAESRYITCDRCRVSVNKQPR